MEDPPNYQSVLIHDLLKYNDIPQEIKDAADSFLNYPQHPPKHAYRTFHRCEDNWGSVYIGELDAKLRKSGYGHCRFINGDLYHGLWSKDRMDTFGSYWWAKTGTIYVGHWQKGQRHGLGTILYGPQHPFKKGGLLVTSKWKQDSIQKQLTCQQLLL